MSAQTAFEPFARFIADPLFARIPDEELLTAGTALTREAITFGDLRRLSDEIAILAALRSAPVSAPALDAEITRVGHEPANEIYKAMLAAASPQDVGRDAPVSARDAVIEECAKVCDLVAKAYCFSTGDATHMSLAVDKATLAIRSLASGAKP